MSGRRKPPTLRDVAQLAGVDPSVVSRLVNRSPALNISDETRVRVEAAIEELGYQPNLTARGLKLRRAFAVGFILPELENPVYAPIVRGADLAAQEIGFGLVLGAATGPGDTEGAFLRLLQEGRVDGLLIASTVLTDDYLREKDGGTAPLVVVNRRVQGIDASVTVDDEAGSAIASRHLLDLGHRRLAVITGPLEVDTSRRRLVGFRRVAEADGAEVEVHEAPSFSATSGYEVAKDMLDRRAPTAVFASTVTLALGVLRAGHEAGVALPDDLSVIALHDTPLADFTQPPLTTVAMPLEELGAAALRILKDRIDGRPVTPALVDAPAARLHVRGSTAVARR